MVWLAETPETFEPSAEFISDVNDPTVGSSSNTTSLRRYGPPSGVRVVSALARFSTNSSARVRCADIPEALTDRDENKLMTSCPPQLRYGGSQARSAPGWLPPRIAMHFLRGAGLRDPYPRCYRRFLF